MNGISELMISEISVQNMKISSTSKIGNMSDTAVLGHLLQQVPDLAS
jgi:hypothetical protein